MVKAEVLDEFFEDLDDLKRGKSFEVEIMERIELLEKCDGYMPAHTTPIKKHSPLKELHYRDVRIFYRMENNIILIVGILKKDVDKFPAKIFKKMNERK